MNHAMKTHTLLFLATLATTHAQYSMTWSTMDGGGGGGTAGTFAMQGTLGQPDTASGTAGTITFMGGYWSHFDETLPALRIFRAGANIVLAWPNPSPGFALQASPEIVPPAWSVVTISPVRVGSEFQVTWGPPVGRYFFRLHRP
jgi:hypothetical protein